MSVDRRAARREPGDRLDLLLGPRRARRWMVGEARRPGRRARIRIWLRGRPTVGLRRLIAGGHFPTRAVPARVRRGLDLDGERIRPLRVEIGGGAHPSPGYLHVDADPRSAHLEHIAPAWNLPFPEGAVTEILAIHVLEHIPPGSVVRTLGEWRRVLAPDGLLQVHVPNARRIMEAYLAGDQETKWAAISAIYGAPADLGFRRSWDGASRPAWSEHQVLYDFDLAREVLELAGFEAVVDASEQVVDRHTAGWAHLIPNMSLVVRARRPA